MQKSAKAMFLRMHFLVKSFALVLLYLAAAKISLTFGTVGSSATLFWAPGGIALAALLLGGMRYLPSVFIAAILAGMMVDAPILFVFGAALGNTVETYIGYSLIKRFCHLDFSFSRVNDLFYVIVLGGMIPSLASAIIGPASLMMSGLITQDHLLSIIGRWWRSDVLGIAFFTPLILLFSQEKSFCNHDCKRWEIVAIWGLSIVVGHVVFLGWTFDITFDHMPSVTWLFPLIIWSGLRSGTRNVALIQLLFLTQSLVSVSMQVGTFSEDFEHYGMANFWMFAMLLAVVGLAIAIMASVQRLTIQQSALNAKIFESQESMLVTDDENVILRVNAAFTSIMGYSAAEAVGQTPRMFRSGRHDAAFYTEMWTAIKRTGSWQGEIWNKRKNGEIFPGFLVITMVKGIDGVGTNYVASLTDITKSKAASDEIKSLAFYDPLTQLPNRRLLLDRLKQAFTASARSKAHGALLFLDLDHFKMLNDTLGHDVGDLLLQQVSMRLSSCVREGDTVARLGGDEFVLLLENLSESSIEAANQTELIGQKILGSLNLPYKLGDYEYQNTPSIGAALFNNHEDSQENLLKHADIAMYQAKQAGRNSMRFFDPQMQNAINIRADLEQELRKAISKKQFQLYYQIQVNSAGKLLGVEAFIRWDHPQRGLMSPADFIPLAEETGLIVPIGQWVLESACEQIQRWQDSPLTRDLTLSVNISSKQLHQADFVAQVQSTIARYEINASRLKLELTESMLLERIDEIITAMRVLSETGVRFSLDDFGTGYSSLKHLKQLPLFQLKIDQSFVHDLDTNVGNQAIVRTIIAMANSLNLSVIAECVENEEQRQFLNNESCENYQGYLLNKPLPAEELEAILKKAEFF